MQALKLEKINKHVKIEVIYSIVEALCGKTTYSQHLAEVIKFLECNTKLDFEELTEDHSCLEIRIVYFTIYIIQYNLIHDSHIKRYGS